MVVLYAIFWIIVVIITAKILSVINRNTIGTTKGYFARAVAVFGIVAFICYSICSAIGIF